MAAFTYRRASLMSTRAPEAIFLIVMGRPLLNLTLPPGSQAEAMAYRVAMKPAGTALGIWSAHSQNRRFRKA
jgi:hypothetical protein